MAVNALFYRSIDGGSERQADSPNRTHFELRVPHGVKLESHQSSKILTVQGISIRPFPGLENFVPAVAYHFCLNLPRSILATWEWPFIDSLYSCGSKYQ